MNEVYLLVDTMDSEMTLWGVFDSLESALEARDVYSDDGELYAEEIKIFVLTMNEHRIVSEREWSY